MFDNGCYCPGVQREHRREHGGRQRPTDACPGPLSSRVPAHVVRLARITDGGSRMPFPLNRFMFKRGILQLRNSPY